MVHRWVIVAALLAALVTEVVAMTLPPNPPSGAPSVAEQIARVYERGLRQINSDLAVALKQTGGAIAADDRGVLTGANFRASRAAALKIRVERRLAELRLATGSALRQSAESSVQLGARQGQAELRRVGLVAPGAKFDLGGFDARAVELAAADMAARLARAAGDHAQRVQDFFRGVSQGPAFGRDADVTGAVAQALITGDFDAARREVRGIIAEGAGLDPLSDSARKIAKTQIDVGGWTGSIREYTEMLVLTRTREATVTARHDRLRTNGVGLVQITGRRSVNFCTRFLGMVFALGPEYQSVDGKTYPLLSSLERKGPPFHPRCSKGTAAYIPSLVSPARAAAADTAEQGYKRALASGTLYTDLRVKERAA